jgi:LysR family transcriptional regulator of abg operon
VQIGITPFLTFSGLGEAFNWFRHRYRNVQLNVIEGLMFQARQRIVVREGHPMQKKPTARGLAACEWVLTQPIGGGQQPRIEAMFSLAGVAPPSRVVVCEALSAMALMRATDVVASCSSRCWDISSRAASCRSARRFFTRARTLSPNDIDL